MKNRYAVPVSVKGIVFEDNAVWLRKNERDEWELPGGKLDKGEQPEQTVIREMEEELGFETTASSLIQANIYMVKGSIDESAGVLVLSYLCDILKMSGIFELEGEAGKASFQRFPISEVGNLNMPNFYKEAIQRAWKIKSTE